MPQHLHRREFIQTSAAAAGAITAAGLLPGAARAASWTTIDAQVHAYERNHPGRPWAGTLVGPAEMTGDQMVAAMDAVGVDGAVLVSPFSMYRYDASYVLEVEAKHPDRFCLVRPVDPNDPAVADIIADWKAKKGTVGIRILRPDKWRLASRTRGSSSTACVCSRRSSRRRRRSPGPNCRRCWRTRPIPMLPSRSPAPAHWRTNRSRTETSGTRSAASSTPLASTAACGG